MNKSKAFIAGSVLIATLAVAGAAFAQTASPSPSPSPSSSPTVTVPGSAPSTGRG